MKCTQAALVLLLGACSIPTRIVNASFDENKKADFSTPVQIHRSLQGKRSGPKKGNNGKGGKKGGEKDCNKDVVPLDISSCPFKITSSGRYVLTEDVQCATGVNGIEINANDVYLDCQDHTIIGDAVAGIMNAGISTGSSDITITNCHATKFQRGIEAKVTGNLIITDSSFNENLDFGGSFFLESESTLTILSSHFHRNKGDPELGGIGSGLDFVGEEGTVTIISSSANGNFQDGLGVLGGIKVSVWDSEFSNNGFNGVFAEEPSFVSLVKSVLCANNVLNGISKDIINPSIAQAVTCDTSDPEKIEGILVCQCLCPP